MNTSKTPQWIVVITLVFLSLATVAEAQEKDNLNDEINQQFELLKCPDQPESEERTAPNRQLSPAFVNSAYERILTGAVDTKSEFSYRFLTCLDSNRKLDRNQILELEASGDGAMIQLVRDSILGIGELGIPGLSGIANAPIYFSAKQDSNWFEGSMYAKLLNEKRAKAAARNLRFMIKIGRMKLQESQQSFVPILRYAIISSSSNRLKLEFKVPKNVAQNFVRSWVQKRAMNRSKPCHVVEGPTDSPRTDKVFTFNTIPLQLLALKTLALRGRMTPNQDKDSKSVTKNQDLVELTEPFQLRLKGKIVEGFYLQDIETIESDGNPGLLAFLKTSVQGVSASGVLAYLTHRQVNEVDIELGQDLSNVFGNLEWTCQDESSAIASAFILKSKIDSSRENLSSKRERESFLYFLSDNARVTRESNRVRLSFEAPKWEMHELIGQEIELSVKNLNDVEK